MAASPSLALRFLMGESSSWAKRFFDLDFLGGLGSSYSSSEAGYSILIFLDLDFLTTLGGGLSSESSSNSSFSTYLGFALWVDSWSNEILSSKSSSSYLITALATPFLLVFLVLSLTLAWFFKDSI